MLLDLISKELLLDRDYIEVLAKTASKRYKSFDIDKFNGEKRLITQPSKELKSIQRCLHDKIVSNLKIHESAFAYKINSNILKHANFHTKNNYLLRLDFKDFFPSIKAKDIRLYLDKNIEFLPEGWAKEDTDLFISLVCRYGKLTIGSPTSPGLSNAICYELDTRLKTISYNRDVKYSRYADDIHFSTNKPNILYDFPRLVKKEIINLDCPSNLFLNKNKTIHTSRKRQKRITGLIVTPQGKISIGRKRKRFIKSQIFKWETLSETEKRSLNGLLSFCKDVEPSYINNLCNKYKADIVHNIIKYQPSTKE